MGRWISRDPLEELGHITSRELPTLTMWLYEKYYDIDFEFPGQHEDEETGLHDNYHRYYNGTIGTYLMIGPIGIGGGINLNIYVKEKPIISIDPHGLMDMMEAMNEIERREDMRRRAMEVRRITYHQYPYLMSDKNFAKCTALCICGVDESTLQKAKNTLRFLGTTGKILVTGKIHKWEVPFKVVKNVSAKASKTILTKVATGATIYGVVTWIYDIGRCSIKCRGHLEIVEME